MDATTRARLHASVVRHHGLRERGELHPLLAKLVDLPRDLFDRSLAAIEDGTQLDWQL